MGINFHLASILPSTRNEKFTKGNSSHPLSTGYSNFLCNYLLFSYYMGFIPFRVSCNRAEGTISLNSFLPQKIFCVINQVMVLLRYAIEVRTVFQVLDPTDPVDYFRLMETISSFSYKMIAFHTFWTKKDNFVKIIQSLESITFCSPNRQFNVRSILFTRILCGIFIALSVLRFLFSEQIINDNEWSIENWFSGLRNVSQSSYFFKPKTNPDDKNDTRLDLLLHLITATSIQLRLLVGFFMDLCIFFCVLSFWVPVSHFADIIKKSVNAQKCTQFDFDISTVFRVHTKFDDATLVRGFKGLKYMSNLISDTIGGFLLPAIAEIVFGYAIDFEDVVLSTKTMKRFTIILFYVSTFITLILAAEICRKIRTLKSWFYLKEDQLEISRNELMMILDDIAHDEVSINADGKFIINYTFVGTMITALFTFFLIRLQFDLTTYQLTSTKS